MKAGWCVSEMFSLTLELRDILCYLFLI